MIVFDMDGVLVDVGSSWMFVHQEFGKDNSIDLRRYIDGKINYQELLKRDISLWGEMHIDKLKEILEKIPLMKGAMYTISRLRRLRYKTAIISAGISILAERVKNELGINQVYANKIASSEDGRLLPKVENAVELLKKVDIFRKLAAEEGITTFDCAVVGDSVYDIPLFEEAGFSIAFNPKDRKVIHAADVAVEARDLTDILRFF